MPALFIFLDGIGLGDDDPAINPLARAAMPTLQSLLDGRRLVQGAAPYHGKRASLLALDASLGVDGLPQSATGQAALLTGLNVPARLGYHYGPKPNPEVAALLDGRTVFARLREMGHRAALLNAYPPRYFRAIRSGRRLYSAIPLAVTRAGYPLLTQEDLYAGRALSADFTGQGWREHLGFHDAPLLSPEEAGQRMAALANEHIFSLFEYWASDYAGHRQNMAWACQQLETLDRVLAGLLNAWEEQNNHLLILTSDHGNMEDLSTRRHTTNPVPCLLIGPERLRRAWSKRLRDLTDVAPLILDTIQGGSRQIPPTSSDRFTG